MLYAIGKEDQKVHFICPNKQNLDIMMEQAKVDIKDYLILQEFCMKDASRITYVDGKCIYNNREYWTKTAVENPITKENFAEHEILDFLGKQVTYDRYVDEFNSNLNRLSSINGLTGEVLYNIEVASEFISLFKEETVYTEFVNITPDELMAKLAPVVVALNTGSFREAKHAIQAMEYDSFLTEERVAKYVAMMDAADAIEYATVEERIYTAEADA